MNTTDDGKLISISSYMISVNVGAPTVCPRRLPLNKAVRVIKPYKQVIIV